MDTQTSSSRRATSAHRVNMVPTTPTNTTSTAVSTPTTTPSNDTSQVPMVVRWLTDKPG